VRRLPWIALAALALCGASRISVIHNVKPSEAVKLLSDVGVFLVDVRPGQDYLAGHIAGAHLLPIKIFSKRMKEIPKDRTQPILIYDTAGTNSALAARILARDGYKDIYNLAGGLRAWTADQRPVEKSTLTQKAP
jgi:hydroxyacylglutathione hydrolase